ncbi:hypothetical protein F7734_06330 [Scytonema sp. UIC 10036]|uniref:hypothetical protein n=1 Tax=Scytonema sp. UIC 10036 TaxID=2304196 RepID=UPI0012DA6F13|nr:hypothetical protein [Scytonema sp. UIC 10036]MUG92094.1 hypothetical protein [Scytonema sp. UIC 10036]
MGILQGNVLSGAWSWDTKETEKCDVVAYEVKSDGMLDGRWVSDGKNNLGTETAVKVKHFSSNNIASIYQITGKYPNGKTYKGILKIDQHHVENAYILTWTRDGDSIKGLGILRHNVLSSSRGKKNCGTIAYLLTPDGLLGGRWGDLNLQTQFNIELAKPKR